MRNAMAFETYASKTEVQFFSEYKGVVLEILLGEMARETLLISQRVTPKRLESLGYQFKFRDLEDALQDILS